MNILHIAVLNNNNIGGPTFNVPKNVYYGNYTDNCALYNCGDMKSFEGLSSEKVFLSNKYKNLNDLPYPFNEPDLVVFQSMYETKFIKPTLKLIIKKIPYIVVPRGALTEKAQNKKKIKKNFGNFLFFKYFIKNAKAVQFLTQNEYIESKKSFKFNDYIIIGNGINKKNKTKKFIKKNNKFVISFIGRIEIYHKGLDYLIEAIKLGRDEFIKYNIKVNIYGIDEDNSVQKLNNLINLYEIGSIVNIYPPVYDLDKENVFLNSDLFIHTSRLEGQPTAIMEAISYGVPGLVTPGTNIVDIVEKYKLGYTSKLHVEDIKNNLLFAYFNKDNSEKISKAEIEYTDKSLDWSVLILNTINEYKRILGDNNNEIKGKNY